MSTPSWLQKLLARRHGGIVILLTLALGVGLLTRLALLGKAAEVVSWNPSLAAAFLLGALYDLGSALWYAWPLALLLAALPQRFFVWRVGRGLVYFSLLVVVYLLLFGAVAEWFFWDEFGVRFNFIAVDYLVYTTEVIGNIRESYPMPLILGALFAASIGVTVLLARTSWLKTWLAHATEPMGRRWRAALVWLLVCVGAGCALGENLLPNFANNYNRELAKNGLWSLFAAFRANQLDYDRFYPTMPVDAAFTRVRALLARDGSKPLTNDPHDVLRWVTNPGPELRVNVIQITVESLSADFLSIFNRASNLTPNLAALAGKSLVFENFYATGTRTDRGMEALTLAVPPTPGRSLVKRPHNENLFTLGSVFRAKGYDTAFIYGGFGYFDNMNYFFGHNGYRVIDRTGVDKKDITFANVWGVCDEDLFRWTLREADASAATGKPFHYFVMTTSNHRPYTFPEGRIDLPSKISGRPGAVKYTDYAIGKFLEDAATKPWFRNTIFVIVADHCASSAGKTELPVQNYHIPLFIYAPGGQVKPGRVTALTSQVDYAPTLLGLLGWSYPSRFFGWNVLTQPADHPGRALIGNYQKLGLYRPGELGILKPLGQSLTLSYDPRSYETKLEPTRAGLIDDTIATYQTACWLFKNGGQREVSSEDWARYATAKASGAQDPSRQRPLADAAFAAPPP